MKKTAPLNISLAAAFLLIGTLAIAQAPATSHNSEGQSSVAAKGIGSAGLPAEKEHRGQASLPGGLERKSGENPHGRVSSARVRAHSNSANNRQQNDSTGSQNTGKAATNSVEYKDPEDMTTRSRAGAAHGADGGANAAAHAVSKHVAGMKYQNRTAAELSGQANAPSSSTEKFKQDFGPTQASKR